MHWQEREAKQVCNSVSFCVIPVSFLCLTRTMTIPAFFRMRELQLCCFRVVTFSRCLICNIVHYVHMTDFRTEVCTLNILTKVVSKSTEFHLFRHLNGQGSLASNVISPKDSRTIGSVDFPNLCGDLHVELDPYCRLAP